MGYFSMIDQADVFVFLDHVQLTKRSWQVRNRIKLGDREKMLTIPISNSISRDSRMICSTPYSDESWKRSHLETIRQAYRKTAFYKEVMEMLEALYSETYTSIGNMNCAIISEICRKIGITSLLYSSSNFPVQGNKDSLLVNICKFLKADSYLSALGSAAYIEKDVAGGEFSRQCIDLFYLNYEHPVYQQQGEQFIPYMGIYDLLFNVGFAEALNCIRKGNRPNYFYTAYNDCILHI